LRILDEDDDGDEMRFERLKERETPAEATASK
jgi:hypothetical protein